jgi:hypothetical protein
MVYHMTKAIQQLGLVVWGEIDPPKFNYMFFNSVDKRSKHYIFMGYNETSKTYCLWDN